MENTKKTYRENKTQNKLKEAWPKLDDLAVCCMMQECF